MQITTLEMMPLKEALEDAECGECGKQLGWGKRDDTWVSHCCKFTYTISIPSVEVYREPVE